MRAALAFELTLGLSAVERSLLALLAAVTTAVVAAWLWSFVDAAAGPQGRGPGAWLAVVASGAGVGGCAGWAVAMPKDCMLRWYPDQWTWLDVRSGKEHPVIVEPRLDLGSWLLLVLRSSDGNARWATAGRHRAGAAWHPLRATLFAPMRDSIEPGAADEAPR